MANASNLTLGPGFGSQWDALKSPSRDAKSDTVGVVTFDPTTKICDIVPSTSDLSGKVTDLTTIATEFFLHVEENKLSATYQFGSLEGKNTDDNMLRAFMMNTTKRNFSIRDSALIEFLHVLLKILTLGVFNYKEYMTFKVDRVVSHSSVSDVLAFMNSRPVSLSLGIEWDTLVNIDRSGAPKEAIDDLQRVVSQEAFLTVGKSIFQTRERPTIAKEVLAFVQFLQTSVGATPSMLDIGRADEKRDRVLEGTHPTLKKIASLPFLEVLANMPNHNLAYLYDILKIGEDLPACDTPDDSNCYSGQVTLQQFREIKRPDAILGSLAASNMQSGRMAVLSKEQLANTALEFGSPEEAIAMLPSYEEISNLDRKHFAHMHQDTFLSILNTIGKAYQDLCTQEIQTISREERNTFQLNFGNYKIFLGVIADLVSPKQIAIMKANDFSGKAHWKEFLKDC